MKHEQSATGTLLELVLETSACAGSDDRQCDASFVGTLHSLKCVGISAQIFLRSVSSAR